MLLIVAAAIPAAAQELVPVATRGAPGLASPRAAIAVRATQPPVLDGRTDDPVWRDAQVIDEFREYEPTEGAETRFKTEVRVAYDDRYLYVMGRMHDPAPDSIVSLLSRRDVRTQSEQLKLVIDSYHDRRTAYQFIVNPAGVKRDFYVYNDQVEDVSWDAVWDVATAIDSLGWTAEFRIPFSQLRFPRRVEHTFGMLIVRDVARTNARISWPLFRRSVQGYVSQAGEVSGIRGLATPRRLEVTPYSVAQSATETRRVTTVSGPRTDYGRAQNLSAGADLKYGLSSNLTLDATVNPDFGQVEADPAVLNLSAFETFVEEERPFLLEGTGIFNFNINCGDIDSQCTGLFYSRRIGREPQLLGSYGDAGSPTSSTILGATKLTGRLSSGLSVGLLDAFTQREEGTRGRTIEPQTNYLVGRVHQDVRRGQSGVGVMFTAVNRELDDLSETVLRRAAYAGGVDFRHRFYRGNYELAATLAGSLIQGSPSSIALTQRDGVHRFQRPDDALAYDPTRTRLAGDEQRISISKFGGGITRFQTVYQRYSPGFEINDVGFLSRADDQMLRNWFALQFNTPSSLYRRAFLNFNHWSNWTTAGLPTNFGLNFNGHVELKNTFWAHLGGNLGQFVVTYSDREARGGPAVRRSPDGEVWGGLEGDRRGYLTPVIFAGTWFGDGGRSSGWWLNPSVNVRATSRFSASLGFNVRRSADDNQWRGNFGVIGSDTTHYTFARLEQTTLGITSRINFTATPTLSLQVYTQPFVSNGRYSDWRELADPRAEDYDARYRPYTAAGEPGGFDVKQFRSNTVLRWEYRSGSTLFLVWTQGRQLTEPVASEFSARRDVRELFTLHPDNTLLLKVSYWLNR